MLIDAYLRGVALAHAPPPERPIFHLDYETFSEIDLKKTGASVYARHPSTEVLMLAYGWSDGPVRQWVPALGEEMPQELAEVLRDPTVTLAAWNAPFEMAITRHTLGIAIARERWLDVMALAYSLSLPGKLSKCGEVIGLAEDQKKLQRGTLLVRKFCKPRKPTKNKPWTRSTAETDPADWQEFLEYNRQDVIAERAIYRRLRKFQMPDHEWRLWHLDQKINDAGIPINMNAVRAAVRLTESTIRKDLRRMGQLTGLSNPNSTQQLLPWLRANGYPFEDLKKGHVERAAKMVEEWEQDENADPFAYSPEYKEVLDLRLRVSKSSVKKFRALLVATDADGRLRGCHQFAGAGRTWRWAGRRFQPQNLSKPEKYLEDRVPELVCDVEHLSEAEIRAKYKNPMDVLVACVRPMVQAPEGYLLVDADLSAIENVVLGWLARDDKILRVFREGLDPYIDFAVDMFGKPYEEIEAVVKSGDKTMRTTAKPGVLGCGYMLGPGEERENPRTGEIEATGLLGYAWNMKVPFTREMAELSVRTFRRKFVDVVQFWWDLDRAVRRVLRTGFPEKVGYLRIDLKKPFMRIRLPGGRFLHYVRPKIIKKRTPWGELKPQVSYEQMDNGRWRRVTTHPGKLAENVTQAVARDILANGMTLADRAGIDIRLHVHDQIVAVAHEDQAEEALQTLIRCMTTRPAWADDKLPLKAAGLTTRVFIKD